ncbi:hypothetical protein [Actinocrispum wychmicini]|uniref:IrrE N-terminal-like domain-containing protein n=1 Tax=Actinocrispum wychmicini TaxID=1213861 RepID=A0A4R2IZ36_9PSEU|nr:hypothetical protein [Actinocrispum wychmicini]TCO49756.1 hypothetical protein EV192_114126 [Actinocrispum wychmicini]
MDLTALREWCDARLADVFIPNPFDLTVFCERLGARRGRPILLIPMSMGAPSPSGMWICGELRDYIVYEQATTPLHQTHIALHEIGHLLCGHESASRLDDSHLARLFPTLDPVMVRRVLGRTGYPTDEELEAEMLACLILERAARPGTPAALDRSTAEALRRLESSL